MRPRGDEIDALVLAGGHGRRLGLGPKALLTLNGRSLMHRAIDAVRPVAGRVIVGVPSEIVADIRAICPQDVTVLAGGITRFETTRILFEASTAPLVIQHDVVHPFVTTDMVRNVVLGARRCGAAMAVVEEGGHAYTGREAIERRLVPEGPLWISRKPIAFLRDVLATTFGGEAAERDDEGTPWRLVRAGRSIDAVRVPPWNIKITTPSDWLLAQALAPLIDEGVIRS